MAMLCGNYGTGGVILSGLHDNDVVNWHKFLVEMYFPSAVV
jgi:hypothetical protein